MKKKKTAEEIAIQAEKMVEDATEKQLKEGTFWIYSPGDLLRYMEPKPINILEYIMATQLLIRGIPFLCQAHIDHLGLIDYAKVDERKYFVADFLIRESIIIEVEGMIHQEDDVLFRDKVRHNVLTAMGYSIFYFSWNDVTSLGQTTDLFMLLPALMMTERRKPSLHLKEELEKLSGGRAW